MRLTRTRECDGSCCREAPRWPTPNGTRCIYQLKFNNKCSIMAGSVPVPEDCDIFPDKNGPETYDYTCLNWPHNTIPGKNLGNCCWQWVAD